MSVDVLVGSVLVALVLIVSHLVAYGCGRSAMVHKFEERAERDRLHRANLLRERGRITDAHPEASGDPAVVRNMRVLGMRPEGLNKPPTRM